VPVNNFSKEQTLASMERLSGVVTKDKAQLWINHDKAQRDTLKLSPQFYE
jgi:N-acyl homoserine lactone hydrolase